MKSPFAKSATDAMKDVQVCHEGTAEGESMIKSVYSAMDKVLNQDPIPP